MEHAFRCRLPSLVVRFFWRFAEVGLFGHDINHSELAKMMSFKINSVLRLIDLLCRLSKRTRIGRAPFHIRRVNY